MFNDKLEPTDDKVRKQIGPYVSYSLCCVQPLVAGMCTLDSVLYIYNRPSVVNFVVKRAVLRINLRLRYVSRRNPKASAFRESSIISRGQTGPY